MVRQLDHLDEPAGLERPRDDEARVNEARAEVVVHLVAVPVPLVDDRVAVRRVGPRALDEVDCVGPEAHRAAEIRMSVALLDAPQGFDRTLGELPDGAKLARKLEPGTDLALLFVDSAAALVGGMRLRVRELVEIAPDHRLRVPTDDQKSSTRPGQ